jgi:hypothetical protein
MDNQEPKGLYGCIFDSPIADIDFLELIRSSKRPVIDLRPLRELYKLDGKSMIPELALAPLIQLSDDHRRNVVFIGSKGDVQKLFEYVPDKKAYLYDNLSIIEILNS